MTKKIIVKFLIGMAVVLFFVVGIIQVNHEEGLKTHYQAFKVYTGHVRIKDYEFINDDDAIVTQLSIQHDKDYQLMKKYGKKSVLNKSVIMPETSRSGYFLIYNQALKDPFGSKYGKGEYKELVIYKKQESKLIEKKLDLIKLEKKTGYRFVVDVFLGNGLVKLKNGHIGLVMPSSNYRILDLETYKILPNSQLKENLALNDTLLLSMLNGVNEETNYFKNIGLSGGTSIANGGISSVNLENANQNQWERLSQLPIAIRYPKAFELLKKDHSFISLMADSWSGEDELNYSIDILSLFYKNGADGLFEKVKVSRFDSVDGKDHIVTTYDEFKRYYKFKE